MTMVLNKPLEREFSDLIARLASLVISGDGLTADETRDLREWLQAARQKHWDELRETRGRRWQAAIIEFKGRAASPESQSAAPRGEGAFFTAAVEAMAGTRPCDSGDVA